MEREEFIAKGEYTFNYDMKIDFMQKEKEEQKTKWKKIERKDKNYVTGANKIVMEQQAFEGFWISKFARMILVVMA